jgi:alkylation response protein AidB-like acyl-CoA dehydrogenase
MTIDLLYSDIEEALRASVADLLADRSGPTRVLATIESDQPCDLALWDTLGGQLGVAALLVPEKFAGVGGSAREAAVVAEELGRAVAPVPFLGSAVLATTALVACAAADPLAALASGDLTAALAVPLAMMPGDPFPDTVRATAGRLTGHVRTVADAAVAGLLVVPAIGPDGPALYSVSSDGVTVTPVTALDRTRGIADVTLAGAPGTLLAGPDLAPTALDEALTTGAGVLASEQLGVAQWCLDTTVRHVKERYQFGRAVGSFQALKHRLADVWLELVTARAAARYAADALAGASDVAVAVSVAQAYCSAVAVHAAEEAVQLHGGIGMTWEHPAHLFLKRAKSSEIALGTPGRHRARLAGLVDLPGPVA